MNKSKISAQSNAIEGKVLFVLLLVILVQFIYPITESNHVIPLIVFQLSYATLFIAGIMISRENPVLVRGLSVMGVIWVIITIFVYVMNQTAIWAFLITNIIYAALQITITGILLHYVFKAQHITRDVIYAAIAIYLLLGAIFIPVYGLVDTLTFALSDGTLHAFSGGTAGPTELFAWQDFVYFSYVTLTTLGYGDILPVTMLARATVSFEAIMGTLYITIIMARLVSLYSADINNPSAQTPES